MDDTYLNVAEGYADDCKITQMQYHSFLPYSNTAMSSNDEIRITIQNMDSYTLPSESYLYIEGEVVLPKDALTGVGEYSFTNNGLAFLFSEMRYELNGVEVQKLKTPGISSSLKGYCAYTPNDTHELDNFAWNKKIEETKITKDNKLFSGCIPLKHLFGFCEDYKKIMLNCNQQLILNRSSHDFDVLYVTGSGVAENTSVNRRVKIVLSKVIWKMPVIKVSDKEKLKLIKIVDSRKSISCAFRTWDLCEYPVLPQNTSHSWTVKSSSLLEKPRFVIIGFQTNRKNVLHNSSGRFDHCKLKNLKVHLNAEVYPYEDFRANFTTNIISVLYKAYTDFQKTYYGKANCEPLLSKEDFQNHAPLIVVDLSHQNDAVKASTVDLRIEFETEEVVPSGTAAYCLILHDQVITYNPFNGDVKKL